MRYSLEKVDTTQACDVLLVGAEVKKQKLERRRRNLGESISTFRQRLEQVRREWAQVQSAFETFAVAYEALPEGKDKTGIKVKIKRLELRLAVLEKKAYTYNAETLLAREMKYNQLENQVFAMENYINSIMRRRIALSRLATQAGKVAAIQRSPLPSLVQAKFGELDFTERDRSFPPRSIQLFSFRSLVLKRERNYEPII